MASRKKKPTRKAPPKRAAAKKKPAKKPSAKKKTAQKVPKKKVAKKSAKKKAAKKKAAAKVSPAKKRAAAKAAPAATKAAAPARAAAAGTAKAEGAEAAPTATLVQHVFIDATPAEVFDALVQPELATAIVGDTCTGEPRVGAAFSHFNGYITGVHEELQRGERIVQSWRTTEWPKGAPASRLEIELAGQPGGTELTMTHAQVPKAQAESYRQGWIDFYWTPLRAHFKTRAAG